MQSEIYRFLEVKYYDYIYEMKIVSWQIFLGFIQWVGFYIGGKKGLLFAFSLVLFWTITQTYNGILFFQCIVQSLVAFVIFHFIIENNE